MLVSTKMGTVVKLVSRGQRAAAQVRTSLEPFESSPPRGLVGLVLRHETRQLFAQKRRHRTVAARCQHPRLVNQVLVEGQCHVAAHRLSSRSTLSTCSTVPRDLRASNWLRSIL